MRAGALLLAMAVSHDATAMTLAPKPDLRYVSPPASDAANQVAFPVKYPTELYPEIEPYESGLLDVGDGHKLYYDVSGNPDGVPAIFLHGGPGAGCSPRCRRFFDPKFYKIVILDQRGSGNSVPNAADDLDASLVENNTPALVGDIERLREHLSIDRWGLVLGGSWGSTLALAYAQAHADRCEALLLRGVFLFGPDEVDYLFCSGGTYGQNPEAWSNYKRFIRETSDDWSREETNLLGAYWHRLTGGDKAMREAAAAAFVGYELSISKTYIDPAVISEYLGTPSILIPFAVMEVHYMLNAGFLRRGQLLDGLDVLGKSGMKVRICHGRADYVCQPQAAYRLSEALKAEGVDVGLEFVSGAGHSDSEPGLVDAMVRASDEFKSVLKLRGGYIGGFSMGGTSAPAMQGPAQLSSAAQHLLRRWRRVQCLEGGGGIGDSEVAADVAADAGGRAAPFELSTPTQAESEQMGIRDWPSVVLTGPYTDACEGGALRYVLEGSGRVSCGGVTLDVQPNSLVSVSTSEAEVTLVWTPVEGSGGEMSSEMVLLTPEYKGVPLLPIAAAFFVSCAGLIAATTMM